MTASATGRSDTNILAGIGWMLITTFMFVSVTGIVRYLGSDMPAIEAAFIRYAFGVVLILPILWRQRDWRPAPGTLKLYALRGLVHGTGVMLWFYAMARIPIAEVTAIGYTSPIFVTIGAALFLGESLQLRRIAAVLVGFAGVMVIIRPGLQSVEMGTLAQLAAAPLFASSFILAKVLTRRDQSSVIVAMLSLGCTAVLLPGAIAQWRNPSLEELAWLGLVAMLATTGHYTLTRAFAAAPITITQPVSFLQLVWAALLGYFAFAEALDIYIFIGSALIVGAATYISHREASQARREVTPPATATKV